jgi:predicted short-subunit dehydrogenase-like oxidoreductase (DUF2520 family)
LTNLSQNTVALSAVIAGAGNVAWHLGHALTSAGVSVRQIYSRNEARGTVLAAELHASYISRPDDLDTRADICILALSDDAIAGLICSPFFKEFGLVVHTAGTVPMQILSGFAKHYGVLYPLQTLTYGKAVDFSEIPLLIEADCPEKTGLLREIAGKISDQVHEVSSEERLILHLAGVICSNFTNRLYALTELYLKGNQMPFEWLRPLILETAGKAVSMSPGKAQTGPAVRKDMKTIDKHMALLKNQPELLRIYSLLTESILGSI